MAAITNLVFLINICYFSGSHDLILKVKGTGMIANLVRSVLGQFNIRKRVKNMLTNEGTFLHKCVIYHTTCNSMNSMNSFMIKVELSLYSSKYLTMKTSIA